MFIKEAKYWKVVVPCKPDTINSVGIQDSLQWDDPTLASFDQGHKWIICLHSSTGHIGIGETGRGESEASVKACAIALNGFDIKSLRFNSLPLPRNEASYGFEVALLDLVGKILGVPVHQILGGKVRDRVSVDYWMGRCSVEDTARRARRARQLGFHGIKIKCALGDPVAGRVKALQEKLPGATVVVDSNERFYNLAGTTQIARELADWNGIIFESPVAQDNLDWYVLLRSKLDIPIALHLAEGRSILHAISRNAADYYNLSSGSPTEFVFCARLCETAACPIWHGSRVDLGILDMAHIHAAAAAPACTLPSDIVGNILREDDLILEPIQIEDGHAKVPDVPGLGVEIDMDALWRYRVE